MYVACINRDLEIIEILLTQPKIDFSAGGCKSILHIVCRDNDTELLKMLLPHKGLDFEIRYDRGFQHTPLSMACKKGSLDVIKMIKESGKANFNEIVSKKTSGCSEYFGIFTVACFSGCVELVQYLLSFPEIDKFPKVFSSFLFYWGKDFILFSLWGHLAVIFLFFQWIKVY